jgi:mono/diheme cytochrome c family protein
MGGRRDWGRHSRWDIPVQEARRLNPIEVSPQSLERGETLFRDNCTRCHGAYGFGDGLQAKDLRVLPPPLRHATRHYNDGELFYIIRKGRDPMPAWEGILSEEELWNLINYLRFEIGAHHGPGFNPGGSYNRGSRFGYCADQYRTGEDMTDNHRDQAKENLHEDQTHQAMEHEDTQGQSNELADQERHDEHEDE